MDCYYEVKVDLVRVEPQTHEVTHSFGSVPIYGNLQDHIEMAGRAAAVLAYFHMLKTTGPATLIPDPPDPHR